MPNIDAIAEHLSGKLKAYRADHIEVHLEEAEASAISYRGRELETATRSRDAGGNVRALVNGGWGFVTFNSLEKIEKRIEQAVTQARLAGKGKSEFAPVAKASAEVNIDAKHDPRRVSLSDKKAILDEYNQALWAVSSLQTTTIGYGDSVRRYILVNSDGSLIKQERADVTLRVNAVAAGNGEVQQSGISMGSRGDFNEIKNLHGKVTETAERAVGLLKAPQAKGGEYTVVLDPVLAGVFVHEAFGHLSEADHIYENPQLKEVMVLGREFGGPHLNIIDDATIDNLRGTYAYDDEGTPAQRVHLIREGRLTGRLHSRETAAKMGEKPSGNARAISFRHPPIVRMANTFIEPRDVSFDSMIADIKEGIYARNWYGGTTSMEMFTFSAGEAFMIRNGKVEELLRPVVLSGNVFETLKRIDAIGNDLDMNQGGGCGKGGQSPLPVSNGSPHIRIQKCLVGGR
ncbi:TldD protein [Dehalogenimonas formicexedens]|uniref:TldD protein n=1 Tax=Dehalogenimonas formicexedens TaxID=1839801 RepID=A0A1P8F5A4_9CHLR|nr:TldD/PmbA family protein [Dehalogenimonas formicexedens]APV43608.1 TldD protein [Dehalogenimonas formicexedens]